MVDVTTIAVFGLALGALYALVALGFTLILSLRGVVNLAFGAYLLFAAYTYYELTRNGLGGFTSIVLAVAATALVSLLLYVGVVRFIEHNEDQTFVVTFLIALALEELYIWYYSPQEVLLEAPIPGQMDILGIAMPYTQLAGIALAIVVIAIFIAFIKYTMTGQAIIAMSLDETGADLVGIDTKRVNYITWLISGAMAGLAGVFLGIQFSASPTMWLNPLLVSFAIIIVGGLGSIRGAILVAFLIGLIETVTVSAFSPSWRGIITFILLIVVILVRPTGLFGREVLDSE
jgi:branched-chain amino acid transport system permease protein